MDSGAFLFLFQQTNCSGTAKQGACKVTPRPRTYKVNVPSPLSKPAMRGRDVGKRAKARHFRQPDATECRAERPLLCLPQQPIFSSLAPSTAPPHMPDITVCNPPPPPPLLAEDMTAPGQRPSMLTKRTKAGQIYTNRKDDTHGLRIDKRRAGNTKMTAGGSYGERKKYKRIGIMRSKCYSETFTFMDI